MKLITKFMEITEDDKSKTSVNVCIKVRIFESALYICFMFQSARQFNAHSPLMMRCRLVRACVG